MNHDFFTFESSWEDFESHPEPVKYHITNVWHEMVHFIGHRIVSRCGFHFGEVSEIDFGASPCNVISSSYIPLGEVGECQDYYGLQNMCFHNPQN